MRPDSTPIRLSSSRRVHARIQHRLGLALLCFGYALAGSAQAGAADDCAKAASEAKAHGDTAVTLYVDSSWGRRRGAAARALTECHRAFAVQGYRLIDLELSTENSDVEGFLVSYVE